MPMRLLTASMNTLQTSQDVCHTAGVEASVAYDPVPSTTARGRYVGQLIPIIETHY